MVDFGVSLILYVHGKIEKRQHSTYGYTSIIVDFVVKLILQIKLTQTP